MRHVGDPRDRIQNRMQGRAQIQRELSQDRRQVCRWLGGPWLRMGVRHPGQPAARRRRTLAATERWGLPTVPAAGTGDWAAAAAGAVAAAGEGMACAAEAARRRRRRVPAAACRTAAVAAVGRWRHHSRARTAADVAVAAQVARTAVVAGTAEGLVRRTAAAVGRRARPAAARRSA